MSRWEHFAVVRLAEELDDALREHLADPADRVEIGERVLAFHRVDELLERAEIAREQARGRLADMPNAEREDESVDRDLAARLDRGHEVLEQLALVLGFALLRRGGGLLAGRLCARFTLLAAAFLEDAVDLVLTIR